MNSADLVGGPAPVLVLLAALILDGALPDTPWLFRAVPHPLGAARVLTRALDRRLNREKRGEIVRLIRGFLVLIVVVGLAAGAGWLVERAAGAVAYGWLAELALLVVLVEQRGLVRRVRAVAGPLHAGDVAAARVALEPLAGASSDTLDEYGVARAATEACANKLSTWVIAPVLWYAVLGLPGVLVCRTVNAMDAIIGKRTSRYAAFGMTAARLDDALNAIPARLAAVIMVIAAIFVPRASPGRALSTAWRQARKHRSFNAGWPVAATAGALGLALGGPRDDGGDGGSAAEPWIGDGRARVGAHDLDRALYLFAISCLILLAAVALAAGVIYRS